MNTHFYTLCDSPQEPTAARGNCSLSSGRVGNGEGTPEGCEASQAYIRYQLAMSKNLAAIKRDTPVLGMKTLLQSHCQVWVALSSLQDLNRVSVPTRQVRSPHPITVTPPSHHPATPHGWIPHQGHFIGHAQCCVAISQAKSGGWKHTASPSLAHSSLSGD